MAPQNLSLFSNAAAFDLPKVLYRHLPFFFGIGYREAFSEHPVCSCTDFRRSFFLTLFPFDYFFVLSPEFTGFPGTVLSNVLNSFER